MDKETAAKKGPDNNKRLAELETGVSTLAVAVAAAVGVKIEEITNPIEAAKGALETMKSHVAELEATIARYGEQTAKLAEAIVEHTDEPIGEVGAIAAATVAIEKLGGGGASAGELAAIARAEAAERRVAELEAQIEASAGDVKRADPEPEPKERPSAARDVGPTFGQLEPAELADAIDSGAELELVFSNGDYEIVDFEPIKLTAKELPSLGGKREIAHPIYVRGGENDDRIHGAALLMDGAQIAYCSFPSPVAIEKGQERRFERAIAFG